MRGTPFRPGFPYSEMVGVVRAAEARSKPSEAEARRGCRNGTRTASHTRGAPPDREPLLFTQ